MWELITSEPDFTSSFTPEYKNVWSNPKANANFPIVSSRISPIISSSSNPICLATPLTQDGFKALFFSACSFVNFRPSVSLDAKPSAITSPWLFPKPVSTSEWASIVTVPSPLFLTVKANLASVVVGIRNSRLFPKSVPSWSSSSTFRPSVKNVSLYATGSSDCESCSNSIFSL